MNLKDQLSINTKEIFGSRTKNRLTIQISYAVQLIMEFYSLDFLVMMDYIEDVAVIENPDDSSNIRLYQVKTKSPGKSYTLSTVISEQWFEKLYATASKYEKNLQAASIVCNTDVLVKSHSVFHNAVTSLTEASIQKNIDKIRASIAKENGITEQKVDLSKYYFVRSSIRTSDHKNQVEHEFESFLLELEPNLQITIARSIYKLLYDELDNKFNNEIDPECTDINEIIQKKCISSTTVKDLISTGLAIQLPDLDKLFSEFDISRPALRIEYSSAYSKIKMDMHKNSSSFIRLKKKLSAYVLKTIEKGVDFNADILNIVYDQIMNDESVSIIYKYEHYLKILIMVLVYKLCRGEAS